VESFKTGALIKR